MKINLRKSIPLLCLCATMLLGMNQASATSGRYNNITSFCSSNNFPLIAEYASSSTACDSCHSSNSEKNAYSSGNYEYFCPEPIAQGPTCTDADNDGYYAEGIDCGTLADFNDNSASAYPGKAEVCSDGIDNDGDGYTDGQDSSCAIEPVCTDLDGDTYYADGGSCGPVDCNDNDASINPGAEEYCSDGIDNNCNGLIDTADMNAVACPLDCTDLDGDGYSIEGGACGALDCDDSNASVNPGALEICDDGIDNNCNNLSDTADSVCQTNDESEDDDDKNEKPWWRKRNKDRDDDDDSNSGSSDDDDDDDSSRNRSRRDRSSNSRRSGRDD